MDIDLLLVLLLIGAIIIVAVVFDSYRKGRKRVEKSNNLNQGAFDELMETRDTGGFDLTGVGLSRILDGVDDNDTLFDEPLTATREDELIISGDKITASRQTEADNYADTDTDSVSEIIEPELIISLSILAKSESGFVGEKLLHCMLSRGLRFGEMNIFHRHKNTSGKGSIQFSLANAVKPGTFDLDDMGSFQTRGITLFMILPGPKEPLKSYKLMLDTAQHLATELKGQLVDSSRSVLTQQTIQHFSEQIQDFERRNHGD